MPSTPHVLDAEARLSRLRRRRRGLDRPTVLSEPRRRRAAARHVEPEAWEARGLPPATAFAVGAMEPVDSQITAEMKAAALRVGADLQRMLFAQGKICIARLQGSAMADTHIREGSDVDLLIISEQVTTFDLFGLRSLLGVGANLPDDASMQVLRRLRAALDALLSVTFGDGVDIAGAKAVRVAGGDLPCPLDVVAAHWHDTVLYERTGQEIDRGVAVLDRRRQETILTSPFRVAASIDDRDEEADGGLRRAIRLCKNLRAEADAEGRPIALSSYEITAFLIAANPDAFRIGADPYLAALSGAESWLQHLAKSAATIHAPDDPLRALSPDRRALSALAQRLTRLIAEIQAELGGGGHRGLRGMRLP